ncbi:MAG: hypothetical protein Q4A32_09630, partial [Lachnospiraceae bacterium]|nr:hypothetical protein [Lachnospiraceae bacterium]
MGMKTGRLSRPIPYHPKGRRRILNKDVLTITVAVILSEAKDLYVNKQLLYIKGNCSCAPC